MVHRRAPEDSFSGDMNAGSNDRVVRDPCLDKDSDTYGVENTGFIGGRLPNAYSPDSARVRYEHHDAQVKRANVSWAALNHTADVNTSEHLETW